VHSTLEITDPKQFRATLLTGKVAEAREMMPRLETEYRE
jgi:hypothetical protein